MRKIFVVVFMLLTLVAAAQQGKGNEHKEKGGAKDVDFKVLIQNYYDAWTISPEKAAIFYDKSPDMVIFDVAPMQYHGWEEYKAGAQKNFFDLVTSLKFILNDDLKVERRGSVAWTTLTFRLVGDLKAGGKMDVAGRHTAIWEKQKSEWVIVHEHLSAPLGGAAPEQTQP